MRSLISYVFMGALAGVVVGLVLLNWLVVGIAASAMVASMCGAFAHLRHDGRLAREVERMGKE